MNKRLSACLSAIAYISFCFMMVSSIAFASPWDRQQSFKVADNDVSAPSSTKPPIPNSMIPKKEPLETNSKDDDSSLTLVEILSNDPSFSHLTKALDAAELSDTLEGPGPFTIFAPNDQAFAKLSPNTLADLMNPINKDKLTAVLKYHIVPGKITAETFKTMKIRTLQGKPLNIKVEGDNKTVNNAKVARTEKVGSNGIIYVIDSVLTP